VIAAYGRSAVWVEMSDGKLRLLPLAWTSLHPRPDPLAVGENAVRLAPGALRVLSAWVSARIDDQKLDTADPQDQKPRHGTADQARAGATAAAAVVGEAGSPGARRRAGRRARGTR